MWVVPLLYKTYLDFGCSDMMDVKKSDRRGRYQGFPDIGFVSGMIYRKKVSKIWACLFCLVKIPEPSIYHVQKEYCYVLCVSPQ